MPKHLLILSAALFLSVQIICLLSFLLYVNGRLSKLEVTDQQVIQGINSYIQSQQSSSPSPQ